MGKRAAIYARVSTSDQTTDNQLRELREVAERHGWRVVQEYVDQGISGAKGRDKRPQFDQLLKDANRRQFDVIMSWSVDRLGRSLQHLVAFLGDVQEAGVDLYLHQQGLNTMTPSGRMMFQMCGVFAEFERAMIQERIKAGIARVRATGRTKSGRPLGRPKVPLATETKIRQLRLAGLGILKIAKEAKVGSGTVQRVLAESLPDG